MTSRVLAEVARFELTNVGVKDRCLTAWLHLNIKMLGETIVW